MRDFRKINNVQIQSCRWIIKLKAYLILIFPSTQIIIEQWMNLWPLRINSVTNQYKCSLEIMTTSLVAILWARKAFPYFSYLIKRSFSWRIISKIWYFVLCNFLNIAFYTKIDSKHLYLDNSSVTFTCQVVIRMHLMLKFFQSHVIYLYS